MNIFQQNKVIIWVLAGLLILSLSVLGTMLYHRFSCPVPQTTERSCAAGCNLLSEELGLTDAQSKAVEQIRAGFRVVAIATADSLRTTRSELVTELSREVPDTARLHQLSADIGRLQTLLTNQTTDQYLQIRNLCTPEQREKLSSLYYEIMGCCKAGEGMQMREACRKRIKN